MQNINLIFALETANENCLSKLQYEQDFVFDALFLVLKAEKKDSGIVLSLTKEYQLASFVIEGEHRLED